MSELFQTNIPEQQPRKTIPREGAKLTRDELHVINELAWAVRNSKQNVGRRLTDFSDSVIKIIDRVRE